MNIVGIVLGVCILCSTTLGRKKRSPESDYWIQYEPIPQDQSKTDSRSEVSTNPQGDSNAVYQDMGYAQNAYPMPAVPQGPKNPVQQVPNAVTPISPSQPGQQVCHRALDLGIILDSSYTVEGVAWQDEKRTAQALIDKLDVNENGVRVGVMVYGTDVEIAVPPFNGYKDVQELKQDIEDIDFMNGWSRTDLVLAAARYQLFQSNGARDGIPKALVVFSDGRTDGESLPDRTVNWTERLKPAVEDLRRDGVNIFCIGVGDVDTTELKVIASDISSVFRPADLEMLVSKLNAISKQQCFNEKNIPSPPQCTTGCVVPSICLLAVQPTCLPPDQQTVTCTVPGSCTSTATTTATSTAVRTTTCTDIQTSTDVRILETVETQTKTAIETSTTTATDTLTETAVSTSTDYHTITKTDTATKTNYVTETNTHTATSTQVHKTTETLSTTDIDTITSTRVAIATKTAIATSTAIATRYVTSTRLTTSLDIDTSTHVTTATSTALETSTKTHVTTATDTSTAVTTATKTHVTTATDTSTAVTTATKMKTLTTTSTALTTSTHMKTDVSTKVLTDTRTLTTTKTKLESSTRITTSTGFTTSTLFTTNTKTETNTAVVTSTALAVTTKVFTTTSTDLATSTHVKTATSTKIQTSTAINTKTLTTVSTDVSTSTHVTTKTRTAVATSTHVTTATSTKVQTSTAIDTKTLTTVSTDVSTSTHVTTKTSTAVATKTSTAVVSVTKTQTKFTTATSTQVRTSTTTDTKTLTSTDVSTSTHVTTETSTAVATQTSTAVVSVTNTKTKFTTVTSTDVDTKFTTATSTKIDTSMTTDTKTLTTVSTDVSTSTFVTTRTSTAVVSVTDTKTQVQTITSTDVDTSTSTHVTTATITATKTSTAVATSTAVTTSTDTSTETKVVSTVKTTTESRTTTKTRTSTVMSTSVVTSCSFNCPSASPTPTLTSIPPTSSSPTVKPAIPAPEIPGCARDLDVGILLHVSGNIPSQSFTTLKNFVAQFASKFPVSAIEAHFGLISYDGESMVEFKFSDAQYYNTDKLQEKIKSLHQMGSGSRIDLAFEKANEKLFSTSGGYRTYMPKTLVVFAEEGSGDGRKPYAQVIAPLVAKGVQIIVVGITNKVTLEELKEIANDDERNVFLVNSFDEMSSIMKDLVQKSCDAPEPEPFHPPENVECKVEYKKLGCYKEQSSNPAMPERLLSKTPDWSDFASWLKEFVCQCAEKTKLMKYTVFGVRDSGECVSGPEAADVYLEYGESTNCVDGHFETCRKDNKNECCGEKNTNYVYGVITEGKEITRPEPLTPTPTPTPAPCKAVVDLVFVMDGSSSIEHFGVGNFNRCKTFAKDMVNSFEVSQSGTHVSVVVFSSSASVIFALDEYSDIPSIDKAIDGIVYPEGGTNIGNALELTKSGVIDVSARTNVHRIIIVMTDGESSDDVTGPSEALKDAGNSLYVLGIGSSVNIRELNNMASDPDEDYVFRSGFDDLDKAVKSIKEKACKEATTPLPTPEPVIVDANFTRTPPSIVYIRIGMTIRFVWEYHVSNRNTAFARYSPIWYYYYSNGASVELASEDKNAAWLWSVSSSCPASYRGRLSKEGQATLVIENVSETDAGYYGCSLMIVSGGPVLSKVQLVLLDARFTRTPPAVVYAYVGETVRLEWLYTVDGGRNNAFGLRSPTWTFYYSDVEYAELAFEDKNMGWKWSIAESCPASLRGRLTKESDATLVISQVSIADSGTYGCSLVMISGQPIISKIQLIVREKPKTEEFRVDFTKLPPREVYAYAGDDVKLEWEYKVTGDKNKGFARYSPIWNLYGEEGEATELAAEDKYSSWRWMVSSTCPASLRGRLRKESSAHLVISKVTIEDSGTYGCSLDLAFGEPLTDKVYLIVSDRPTQRPTGEVTPPCKAVVDLVFLIDGSTSIEQFGMGNFKRCLNFAKTMVRNFEVSTQGTHVSVVMFTSKVQVEFTLTEYFDPADIERAIDAIKYPGGSTFAGEGLKVVKNVFDATGRSNVPHALIIMTDGQSIDDIETPSSALKNDGTLIYCLGIGSDYNLQQLNTMASAPPSGHVFVADFDKLDTVVESIKQKACFDASRITPTITPATEHPETVKPEVKCKATVDLGFLIDGSTSIEMAGAGNFIRCKDFVKKMIANFDISQSGTHVGVAQFASRVFVNFTFNDYYDKGGLDKAVDDIPMLYGGTNLGKALKAVRTELFGKGSRSNVSRILIVLSDGASEDDVDEPSKALRDQGITIFCLGIGNKTNEQQLNIIASDPDSDHVFRSGFSELGNMVDLIERKACPDNPDFHIEGGVSSSSSYSYSNGYCSVRYNKIGCYGDDQKEPRPISTQLFTDQNPDSDLFSGMTMNLGQWDQYMSDVVCRCAQHADDRDFKLFSIQNFGECWSGFDAEKTYSRNGESQSCISNKMEACDSRNQLLCVGNRTSNFVYEIDFGDGKQAEACSVTFEKVGCYKDNHGNPRPFSDLVSTDMDPKSQVYSGSPVNKGDWNTYLADVVCRCAQNTQEYEYEYFGIQNLGECWTGPTANRTYTLDGQSDQCLSKDMQACIIDSPDNCVGQENTNFVYRIQTTDVEASQDTINK